MPPDIRALAVGAAAACLAAASAPPASAGETLERVLATKSLVLAVDEEYPPFAARRSDGKMAGFDIDVAKELAARLGAELKVVAPGWNRILAGNWDGAWDIAMSAIEPTAERQAALAFPAAYADAPAVILVRSGAKGISTAGDLHGKRVGVEGGSRYEAFLQDLSGGAEIVPFEIEPMAIDDLVGGQGAAVDAVVLGLLAAQDAIGIGKPVAIAGAPLFRQPYVMAVDKGDPDFEARISGIVETMRADGTLKRLTLEHLGVDAAPPAP
jgi:polar amino acid transport system substrate-binding protein